MYLPCSFSIFLILPQPAICVTVDHHFTFCEKGTLIDVKSGAEDLGMYATFHGGRWWEYRIVCSSREIVVDMDVDALFMRWGWDCGAKLQARGREKETPVTVVLGRFGRRERERESESIQTFQPPFLRFEWSLSLAPATTSPPPEAIVAAAGGPKVASHSSRTARRMPSTTTAASSSSSSLRMPRPKRMAVRLRPSGTGFGGYLLFFLVVLAGLLNTGTAVGGA